MSIFSRRTKHRAKHEISVGEPNEPADLFSYLVPDELTAQRIEENAVQDAAVMKNCPALVAPWQRAWVANSPWEEIVSFRRAWYEGATTGKTTPELQGRDAQFAAMGKEFLDQNGAWKNIVEKDFGVVKAMYYREELPQGGAAYWKVPSSLMALAPSVSPAPQSAVQIRSGSSAAPLAP